MQFDSHLESLLQDAKDVLDGLLLMHVGHLAFVEVNRLSAGVEVGLLILLVAFIV